MRKLTIRHPRVGDGAFERLESLIGEKLPDVFKDFLKLYSGFGLEEDYFLDINGREWLIGGYSKWTEIYKYAKKLKEDNLGVKLPFAYDTGRWYLCLCFDDGDNYGKILVRPTHHNLDNVDFIVIANSFEDFISRLRKRPRHLKPSVN